MTLAALIAAQSALVAMIFVDDEVLPAWLNLGLLALGLERILAAMGVPW
jgi:hypothetical protein